MNFRLIALLIALVALSVPAQAADKAATAAVAERAALMQTLKRGQALTSNHQQYQVLPGVRAVASLAQESPQQTLTRVGGAQLIETKGVFVVFTTAQQSAPGIALVNGATFYPTVFNPRTQGVGILPGTINVKLKNMANAAAVASGHGLEMVREFAHLQTVFYRVQPGQDVVAAAGALSADSRVTSAEAEVIENMAVPH